jgi:hypothetical protein
MPEALRAGKEHTALILNYTRTGTPFWNRTCRLSISERQADSVVLTMVRLSLTWSNEVLMDSCHSRTLMAGSTSFSEPKST